jgi:hypothetical protein
MRTLLFLLSLSLSLSLAGAAAPAERPVWSPRIVATADGTLLRVTRVDAIDIAFDVVAADGTDSHGQPLYRTIAPAQAVPPLPGYDPATATELPTDAAIAAHIASELAKPPPEPPVYRVLKDTIVQRIKAAGKLTQLAGMIAGLPADQKFEFDQSNWFSSNNALLVGGCTQLGLDPAEILAPDPLAP